LWSDLSAVLLKASARDLFVCDLHMTMMSGADFCQIIRRYNTALQIVFFTDAPEQVPGGLANAVVAKHPDGLARLNRVAADLLRKAGSATPSSVSA
jgi:CheY-like chemotaxis protein